MEDRKTDLFSQQYLTDLANAKMPFGKYKDRLLLYLPEAYLVWFRNKGFPPGKLGLQLADMYEIKANGLEDLLKPLIKKG